MDYGKLAAPFMTSFTKMQALSRRSFLTRSSAAAAATIGSSFWTADTQAQMPAPQASNPLEEKLDAYIAAYMPAMNAPGLTLSLADTAKTLRLAGYGYANVDLKTPVNPGHLFQIGSITKSFVALVLLQLRDEGKLDLQKPVLGYLPWLPITERFGPITVHHLLTHSSGLPDALSIFSSDPAARLVQAYKPGEHFHYCNAGFDILGELASKLDGRPWRKCVQARIFNPLEMIQTAGVISTSTRDRSAIGYEPFWDDGIYPRLGKLAPAANLVMDDTAGCIASTPGDMARYLRMLLNHGQGPKSRIVSEEGFKLFSTPYIKAEEFSPTASYGYGIAVDTLDGHKILRHTGGMVSFASSIHVDLDSGVAAFASINAMQGYRPTAVTEYAVRLLRAQHESTALPEAPAIDDPRDIDNAADYEGTFSPINGQGSALVFQADGKRLSIVSPGSPTPLTLQHAGGDTFLLAIEGMQTPSVFARIQMPHLFQFGRREPGIPPPGSPPSTAKPPVVELNYGPALYTNLAYDGPKTFQPPDEFAVFSGHYRSDSPWGGDLRVFVQKNNLTISGSPIIEIDKSIFRVGEEPWSPETAEFYYPVEGKTRLLKLSGIDFWRVEVD